MSGMKELLGKHDAGTISGAERNSLHQMLKEHYGYGETMPEYRCRSCGKPLVFTWASGPFCTSAGGGCGQKP